MAVGERARPQETAVGALAAEVPSARSTGWWGMVLFITTEGMLFAALIASYFYLRFRATPEWPPGAIRVPELRLPLIMSALLFSSTVPMVVADRAARRGRMGWCKLGLLVTVALGAAFLTLQGVEYQAKLQEFTPATNVYGSLFYSITGFHGTHVLVGLLLLTYVQVAAWRGKFPVVDGVAKGHERIQIAGMYWHFVDAVWAAILLSLYLSPNV